MSDFPTLAVCAVVALGVLLRLSIAGHPYSGHHNPPMYGDYEAQRHWMEVTLNLKVKDWYENSTDNDLGYWGIDYPPLSAYQSWISGKFVALFDPQSIELHSSRGYENEPSKLGMRLSVIASDMVLYIPACVIWSSTIQTFSSRLLVLLWMICNPALLIIDHGHFQYNSISLGLTVASVYSIISNRYVQGSILFCAALNHKQMTLYFAPAIFSHLLGVCMQQKGLAGKVNMLLKLGVTVMGSFSLFWFPYWRNYSTFIQVVKRIFPMQRGLFEDYVANFWCVSSLVFKWKKYLEGAVLAKLCALATMLFTSPTLLMQATKPQNETFILSLANSSLAFFLFSYQVHEKSVLIPLIPLSMLLGHEARGADSNVFMISLLTMYPLLKRDGLRSVYWAMQSLIIGIQCITCKEMAPKQICKNFISIIGSSALCPLLVLSGLCLVHVFCYFVQPWFGKEYLSDAIMMLAGFGFLSAQLVITNIRHFSLWRSQKLHDG